MGTTIMLVVQEQVVLLEEKGVFVKLTIVIIQVLLVQVLQLGIPMTHIMRKV